MTSEEAAQMLPGAWLEYELSFEHEGSGVIVKRSVTCRYLRPSKSLRRVVIRPEFHDERMNRARAVGIGKLRVLWDGRKRNQEG